MKFFKLFLLFFEQDYDAALQPKVETSKWRMISAIFSQPRACSSWRWTHPMANLENPNNRKFLNCDKIDLSKPCRHRRCELLGAFDTTCTSSHQPQVGPVSGFGYFTGNQSCYKAVVGYFAGCFKQNLRYEGDVVGTFPLKNQNWGACALKCRQQTSCKFWSWSSDSCMNCVPYTCSLHGGDAREVGSQFGHLGGGVDCQDILYTEEENIKDNLAVEAQAQNGKCATAKSKERPNCPAQEVPGYR